MAGLGNHELEIRSYNPEEYRFRPVLTRAALEKHEFGPPVEGATWDDDVPWALQALHTTYSRLASPSYFQDSDGQWTGTRRFVETDYSVVNTRETDQKGEHMADIYEGAYDPQRPAFMLAYLKFLEEEVQPLFGEPIVYQKFPSLRVHMPGNRAVGEWHSDSKYHHLEEAVNFWVPATDASGTNALFVQTSQDEQPLSRTVNYGQYIVFDGVNLLHGNELNDTADTRVSFDFRVIPESRFKPNPNRASVNSGLIFDIGGRATYYSLLNDENLAILRNLLVENARETIEHDEAMTKRSTAAWLARAAGFAIQANSKVEDCPLAHTEYYWDELRPVKGPD
jgi:hypothetical protein